ncbi:hypothetical protein BUALT_Bualt06G0090300 [Buddleja alternifolia]|uniref:Uncharacterized protein n=1 Tax=Buddleja alternifolia TaxID=168488 RepID=A0AAV6XF67_9LAMI|nr:hypothetical protein BUALT_Bualt06G0090300 [Buddleja alternifolia]
MLTPPLHPSVSIPFRWEEAPGKPRATTEKAAPPFATTATPPPSKNTADPSRKITIMSSPAVVLDGPYMGRSLSLACTFSFRKGPVPGRVEGLRPGKKSSARMSEDEKKLGRGSSDFSPSLGDFLRSEKKNVKITRVRRRGFNLSSMNSNLLTFVQALSRRFHGFVDEKI